MEKEPSLMVDTETHCWLYSLCLQINMVTSSGIVLQSAKTAREMVFKLYLLQRLILSSTVM